MSLIPLQLDPVESSRITIQGLRWQLLNQDYGDDPTGEGNIREAIDSFLGQERAALIPRVDFSNNALETAAKQLTTPGLYQQAPMVEAGPGGERIAAALADAKYWLWMQRTQFLAAGMGDAFLHFVLVNGRLEIREVRPHACFVECSPENASKVLKFRELRQRDLSSQGMGVRWCYDVYDLQAPAFWIETAEANPVRVTNVIGLPAEGVSGDAYQWRIDGKAVLPYIHYTTTISSSYWHYNERRGLTRSTLRAMAFDTMAGQSAMDASHSTAIALNVTLPGGPTQGGDGSGTGGIGISRIAILPGSLMSLSVEHETTPASIHQLRPAADLVQLRMWAQGEEARLLTRLGLSADDVKSAADNPTSADALMIKRDAKQRVSDRMEPFFRDTDLQALALAGAMLGGPTTGYTISYYRAPISPDEREAEARADQAELDLGVISRVQLYMRRHPGITRQQATAALKQIQADEAALEVTEPPDTSDAGKPADDTPDPTDPPQE
jgi:hypothetical protein